MGCAASKDEKNEIIILNSQKKKIILIGPEQSGKTLILYKL